MSLPISNPPKSPSEIVSNLKKYLSLAGLDFLSEKYLIDDVGLTFEFE